MSTTIINRPESRSEAPVSESSKASHPSLGGHRAPAADNVKTVDSGISRILIVDDNPDILKLVARMAEDLGYHATTAENAVDALYHLAKAHYDLVITDDVMPFIDGYQLADQIKEKHSGTKVIIMTAHYERDVADLLDGSGIVDGLLLKPFNLKSLKEKFEMDIQPRLGKWMIEADIPH